MKRTTVLCTLLAAALSLCAISRHQDDGHRPAHGQGATEGVITSAFVEETEMQADLLRMLADFATYMVADFQPCVEPNSLGETCGCFRGENTMANDERGVRPNADLSMVCAFLVKYAKPAGVPLPVGVTWQQVEDMAMQSLVFAYSTHKANRLKVCRGGNYWGSTSATDFTWESSLWAMSVAYSAFFQWDRLTAHQRTCVYNLLKAECDYELERDIPTGFRGDTKAEENGWETNVLAATLGLFPDDPLAPQWFGRLREFAVNSYSHPADANDTTVLDPWYDHTTVADLYRGANLYDDYSLQNHNLFHTSYQNVVMQELGESALALRLFQKELHGQEKWRTTALTHNCQAVQDRVLNWLALADGELAMPNGNDWSLFLFDQITSYSTLACFGRDPHALMLENMAYKYIRARQRTTPDGSWLLRPDVGARRMGVQAHRVMMTYLMHEAESTANLRATRWDDFRSAHSEARLIPRQRVVRASTPFRFSCFSWSEGLRSYTGYFAANSPDRNKIVVPFRAHNTGNITGWYEVADHPTDARPLCEAIYQTEGDSYVMNGALSTNGGTLTQRFSLYSSPLNAIIYLDHVTAQEPVTITAERGGLLAISTDELTRTSRTLYHEGAGGIDSLTSDGSRLDTIRTQWVNIDQQLGVATATSANRIAFGDRDNHNSILTSKLYPLIADTPRKVERGEVVDIRHLVYYSLTDAAATQACARTLIPLQQMLPEGWNGLIAPDGATWEFVASNFSGTSAATLNGVQVDGWAPVFHTPTAIADNKSCVSLTIEADHSIAHPLPVMVQGADVTAQLTGPSSARITANTATTIGVRITGETPAASGSLPATTKRIRLKTGETIEVGLDRHGEMRVKRQLGGKK